jgi:hypothetical protein
MKIFLIAIVVCIINMFCVSSAPQIFNTKYNVRSDTIPPNPASMQPVPQSTVNGNGTPVLPDTNRRNSIDTFHTIH